MKTGDIRVAEWGTYVTTTSVDTQQASLKVVTTVENIGTQADAEYLFILSCKMQRERKLLRQSLL